MEHCFSCEYLAFTILEALHRIQRLVCWCGLVQNGHQPQEKEFNRCVIQCQLYCWRVITTLMIVIEHLRSHSHGFEAG